jgi:multiple PDZ domain protein
MLVVAVVGGGCIARDGRIVPGDYLVSVNNESLRKVTNSQARAILRRTQLLSTDIRYSAHTNLILAEYVTES